MAVPETPITRLEQYWAAILDKIQGGGGSPVTIEPLTVTENGTTTAPGGKAYSPVTVDVPNSYGASDEGKVVNNGALVAQTAHAPVTANGTIDTTLNNSVPVDVPNPNYVETITGTVANPWGTYTIQDLFDLAKDGDATVYIEVANVSGLRFLPRGYSRAAIFRQFQAPSLVSDASCDVYKLAYGSDDSLTDAILVSCKSDGITTANIGTDSVTTLTIVHHPMPDNE